MAAADSSTPSSCSSALLELRELLLTHEPTMTKNVAPWQQLGAKRLNRAGSSSCRGHLSLGCPTSSPTARQCGAPSVKTGGRRQSHHLSCGTSHSKGLRHDFRLLLLEPPWPATMEGGQELLWADPLCQPSLQ